MLADMTQRKVDFFVYKGPGGRAARLEALEQGLNSTIMVWI